MRQARGSAPNFAGRRPPGPVVRVWGREPERGIGRSPVLLLVLALFLILVTWVSHGAFWNAVNVDSLLVTAAITAIPATGMTIVILTGGIDVSIGSMLGLVCAIGGTAFEAGWPLIAVAPLFLLLGALAGATNAAIVIAGRVPPVVATLGTLSIFRMCVFLVMGSQWITAIPPSLTTIFIAGHVAFLPNATILALLVMGAAALFLRLHRTGRHIYAVGNNDEAARLAGIPVRRIQAGAYVLLGVCTAIAALLQLGQSPMVQTSTGTSFELSVIAAVVLGGTELSGGKGNLFGTLLGVLIVGLITDGIVLMRIQPFWSGVVLGLVILVSIGASHARSRE